MTTIKQKQLLKESLLDASRVRDLLSYDDATGEFRWKVRLARAVPAGSLAGCLLDNGYRSIAIQGYTYKSHRLAWLHVHGVWPTEDIDHINGDKADNRLCNLRQATRHENMQNLSVGKANSTGYVGVSFRRRSQRWQAYITLARKRVHLGFFASVELAVSARATAKAKFHAFQSFDRGVAA